MKILVAEENPLTRNLLADTLEEWGHEVEQCSTGDQVIARVEGGDPPNVAIFSRGMSGVSGDEICKRIHESDPPSACYAIVLVARERQEDGVAALEAGADDYLCKPFVLGELKARINTAARIVGMNMNRVERETAHYVEQLEQSVAELQESRSRIVSYQEAVRSDIAADLHGPVQTEMSLLYFKLMDIKEEIDPSSSHVAEEIERVAEELDNLRENAVRKLSHKLYPSKVRIGLIPGLRSLQDKHADTLRVTLQLSPEVLAMEPAGDSRIPYRVRLALYRIVEEAVNNTIEHAEASDAYVRIWLLDANAGICVSIEDNGRGFDPGTQPVGLGVATMRDYVGSIGGSIRIDATPGQGTTITATVPLAIHD